MKFPAVFRNPLLLLSLFVLGLTSAAAADWPRQVTDSSGVHTLESKPTRIVSTSVTLTGSLLAIDAPVVASGATTPNNRVADGQGFLRQWGDMAKQRKVARLYIGEPSAEAVAAQMPDLILISATGGDSALALYDQLSAIAPTLIINYDDKSWQALLTQLGEITGHEKQAAERIAAFDKQLAQVKQQMTLPPQPVNAIVYTAAAHSANLWTTESAQGKLLHQLGFTLADLPAGLQTSTSQGKRHDIIQLGGENLATGLNGEGLFVFAGDEKDVAAIYANPLLAHLPSVKNKRVWALGTETFRLDYYSAMLVLQRLNAMFK
ncbi:Fe2+-enterobactin ABC transporter substrate-binding protein [Enterobacter cloacae complex sp. S4]|mgnify:FL=1|uniref:Ferric enterobactin-binding periplasmic protein FepB n=1 Tax=Enterobacter roggenkampii TaxID=1812935 RepID=A0AAX1WC81_9ENTR|nr:MULTISPECIES: Fe2+-enterobactin ABC transporter substrate-binding protein [Enterobacter cloacae complex]EHF8254664.1 Fe2+-enterobactin ABC transporter substrate-binding protein [Enterobacter roggenkampii]ELD8602274.1 Fe2+-enterobactin ABC transporter substrate-binding protein [Enterobacter roggenkampii]KTJ34962.1 iron-enterobactin ABC transporter substrate-binding protein [Enterobacter roggenkampii]MBE4868115.1 Fe2+-enterobactin ABC transporter substrate-binding protein [Enterobacter cloacae